MKWSNGSKHCLSRLMPVKSKNQRFGMEKNIDTWQLVSRTQIDKGRLLASRHTNEQQPDDQSPLAQQAWRYRSCAGSYRNRTLGQSSSDLRACRAALS